NPSSTALWSTGTYGTNASTISMQDDANLVLYVFKWQAGVYLAPTGGTIPYDGCRVGASLFAGQILASGACLESSSGRYMLLMQSDGNLFIYDRSAGQVTWAANTYGHPGAFASLQSDGNFVVYNPSGVGIWSSGTYGTFSERLDMGDDGRIIIYKSAWSSGTSTGNFNGPGIRHPTCDVGPGTGWTGVLGTGSCFVSPNGRYELLMQTDGNLVIYDRSVTPNAALWSTGTAITPLSPGYVLNTFYKYDLLDNLTCVEQHGNTTGSGCSPAIMAITDNQPPAADATSPWRIRRGAYDSFGRLRWSSDPESGLTSFQYNNDGVMISATDARGITINFNPSDSPIDVLHRVTKKTYSNGEPAVTYTYDVASYNSIPSSNQIGQLVHIYNGINAASTFAYDPIGRLIKQTNCLPSNCTETANQVTATYDLAGNLNTLIYPSGRKMIYDYNSAGHFTKVNFDSFNGIPVNFAYYNVPPGTGASTWGYWPTGAMRTGVFGNGVQQTLGINPRQQLNSITQATTGQTLLSKTFNLYDSATHNNG